MDKVNGCFFLTEDDDLLEKYNTFWEKISTEVKKEFDSEPVFYKNFLKSKIKSHGYEVTNFYDKDNPKVDSNHTCLVVISQYFALNKDGNYYPQVFIKDCKYIEKKVIRQMNNNLSDFSYDDDFDDSDEKQFFLS